MSEGGEHAVQEERRLFYVALTRAQDRLTLTRAERRSRFGRDSETIESRFTTEIPEKLLVRESIDPALDEPTDESTTRDYLARMRARFE